VQSVGGQHTRSMSSMHQSPEDQSDELQRIIDYKDWY
jgi:hypothetical protein